MTTIDDFDIMTEETLTAAICIVATCIIAVLIIAPVKKCAHRDDIEHHAWLIHEPTPAPAPTPEPVIEETPAPCTVLEPQPDEIQTVQLVGELTLPPRSVTKTTMLAPTATTAAQATTQPADLLKIPLKYKHLTMTINADSIDKQTYPAVLYGDSAQVDKLTIKCHFIRALLHPQNKYVPVFVNICTWLAKINYKGPAIDLVIQQDGDIELDQNAVNARKYITNCYFNEGLKQYGTNQTYGRVTPLPSVTK